MNFWSVRNLQKFNISINPYLSSNKILSHVTLVALGWSHLNLRHSIQTIEIIVKMAIC